MRCEHPSTLVRCEHWQEPNLVTFVTHLAIGSLTQALADACGESEQERPTERARHRRAVACAAGQLPSHRAGRLREQRRGLLLELGRLSLGEQTANPRDTR